MAEKTERNETARDSGFQNPEDDGAGVRNVDLTTSIPPPGAGDIFNESRGNFGLQLEKIDENPGDIKLEEFGTPGSNRGKIEFGELNHELLMSLIDAMKEMKTQVQSMANEIARNNQANIDLRSEFTEKFKTMQATIASEVHQIYEPIKRHVTGLTKIVQDNESKSAVTEVSVAQMQLDVNAIKKRVENLERKDKIESPNTESMRIVQKPDKEVSDDESEEELEEERRERIRTMLPMDMHPNKIKIKPPTYDGSEKKRPMKFIKEFRRYCEVTNPTVTEMKYLLGQCLEKAAKEWWVLIEDRVEDFDEVEKKFVERFWSMDVQRKVRKDLEFGHYSDKDNKISKVEYTIHIFGAAKDLIPPPSDEDIIASLSQHYTDEIQATIISRGFKTLEQLIEFLGKMDRHGPINSKKEKEAAQSSPNQNQNKNEQRPFRMPQQNNWNNQGGYQNNSNRGNPNWNQNNRPNGGYNNNSWNNQQNRNYQQNYNRPNNGHYQQNYNQRQNNGYPQQNRYNGNYNQQNGYNRPNQNQNSRPQQNNGGYRPPNNSNNHQQNNPPEQQIQAIEVHQEPQPSTSQAGNE
ncbi:probable cyclin-dependent serine/threonine-protein kinase DDB_G0292550 [Venturia canescens]|uniref:probable cyclin-dependent serine/threonine-protein kinase DDB_G0292550 n=1 Tax=Venturia canescens TaxID=32260 RepID=UPI001C9C4DE9|nr:probable cyclin-dependent serine/threonine-protein kinase DDB_G0292550 [Venturia canescens]